jgi:hypothetical protein
LHELDRRHVSRGAAPNEILLGRLSFSAQNEERFSDIFTYKIIPNSIVAGLDPPIQLRMGGSTYRSCPCRVNPHFLEAYRVVIHHRAGHHGAMC